MAKLVFEMNVSLDGYVNHDKFAPGLELFRHFIERTREITGMVYGRRMYEIMRYWDEDQAGWEEHEHAYAAAWRSKPKWVVSRTLKSVGPNATLISDNVEAVIAAVKAKIDGELEIAGPVLAGSLADPNLIDEYRLYVRPVVLGAGNSYFNGAQPKLRFVANERIGEDAVRLTYVPAG